VKIGIGINKKIVSEKRINADRSGIGIKITGTARCLSIAKSRILNCLPLEIVLNAMVMVGMIDLIGSIRMMMDDLMS